MRIDRRFLNWGTFFLAMGAVLLVADADLVDGDFVDGAWRLWPFLFLALGAGILLRRTRFGLAGGMLVAAVPGLVLGGLIAVGPRLADCGTGNPASVGSRQGTFDGPASVEVTLRCGDLSVTTASGTGWALTSGNTRDVTANVAESPNHLSIASGRATSLFGLGHGRDVWRLTVPTANPIGLSFDVAAGKGTFDLANARLSDMTLSMNAGSVHLDLSNATLDHLAVTANAGSTSVTLPASADFSGTMSINAGSLKLCAPAGIGLRIHSHVTLGHAAYPGYSHSGDTYESPDYAAAGHHAELTVSVNVGSIDLEPMGGCL